MSPWYWALIAWVIGEIMGFTTIIVCMGSGDKEKEEYTGYRTDAEDKKKTADAATSTAARETGRKDFFL